MNRKIPIWTFAALSGVLVAVVVLASAMAHSRAADPQDNALLDDEAPDTAAAVPNGVRVLRDLHYGKAALQTLDVYLPPHADSTPVILMVHGGGWRLGDKRAGRMVDSKVARWVPRGFIFISVDYGLLPETPVAQQIEDVAHALAYAQSHAREWGGDPKKFILMGHSAGAHLIDVLAAAPARAIAAGAQPWLGTVSLDSAAVDVPHLMQARHMPLYDAAFGRDPAVWNTLSPIDLLAGPAPPVLAVCSTLRRDDSCGQSRRFVERATTLGIRASVLEQALTHMQINATLGTVGTYTDAVETFMATLDPAIRQLLESHS